MKRKRFLRFLSLEDVVACGGADIGLAEKDICDGFSLLLERKINLPHKTTLKRLSSEHEANIGLINFMPVFIDAGDAAVFGCKAIGVMPSNREKGFPRATGLITLFDPETKIPLCVMDAQVISATRTGAVSLAAVRKLAYPGISQAGLVGAGVNMRTQLLALKEGLPGLKKVFVYSRGVSKHEFAGEMSARTGLDIQPVDSAREAVEGRELIVTCLANAEHPVVKNEWVKKDGVTVINIGCHECETSVLRSMDRVVCDVWEHVKHRGVQTHAIAVSRGIFPEDKIEELAPILAGKVKGRERRSENIFFAPVGVGFHDALVAWRVYKASVRGKIGTDVPLWHSSKWI